MLLVDLLALCAETLASLSYSREFRSTFKAILGLRWIGSRSDRDLNSSPSDSLSFLPSPSPINDLYDDRNWPPIIP